MILNKIKSVAATFNLQAANIVRETARKGCYIGSGNWERPSSAAFEALIELLWNCTSFDLGGWFVCSCSHFLFQASAHPHCTRSPLHHKSCRPAAWTQAKNRRLAGCMHVTSRSTRRCHRVFTCTCMRRFLNCKIRAVSLEWLPKKGWRQDVTEMETNRVTAFQVVFWTMSPASRLNIIAHCCTSILFSSEPTQKLSWELQYGPSICKNLFMQNSFSLFWHFWCLVFFMHQVHVLQAEPSIYEFLLLFWKLRGLWLEAQAMLSSQYLIVKRFRFQDENIQSF